MTWINVVVVVCAASMSAGPTPRARPPLLLTGAMVLDPGRGAASAAEDVLIVDGRIRAIGRDIKAPVGTQHVDLSGRTLMPGLIDLHSHLLLHPYDEAKWDDQVLRENVALRTARAVAAAAATLEAGFTTLRDLGTEGADYADVGLRDAIAADIIRGPRVFAATRAIVATGCYAPAGLDPRWSPPIGAQTADGADGLRRAVREQIHHGADWIKVYADFHRAPGAPATPTFSLDELKALVDEARSAGVPVAAHATTPKGIRRAVLAGVRTIEHAYEADDAALTLMREHGVVLCPTLAAAEAYERFAGWKPGTPDPPRLQQAKRMVVRAMKLGVTIACGSDAGVFAHGDNVRELELMAGCGMPPADVLRAATSVAATVLGRERELGRVAEGAAADLLAVRGDPRSDLSALRRVECVVKDGRVEFRRAVRSD